MYVYIYIYMEDFMGIIALKYCNHFMYNLLKSVDRTVLQLGYC